MPEGRETTLSVGSWTQSVKERDDHSMFPQQIARSPFIWEYLPSAANTTHGATTDIGFYERHRYSEKMLNVRDAAGRNEPLSLSWTVPSIVSQNILESFNGQTTVIFLFIMVF